MTESDANKKANTFGLRKTARYLSMDCCGSYPGADRKNKGLSRNSPFICGLSGLPIIRPYVNDRGILSNSRGHCIAGREGKSEEFACLSLLSRRAPVGKMGFGSEIERISRYCRANRGVHNLSTTLHNLLKKKLSNDCQKARTVWIIGTQPFIPAVYGVKAPL